MNRREYVNKLKSLRLNKSCYRVISGGAMLLYGLMDSTADIDIRVKPAYFEKLKTTFNFRKSSEYSNLYEIDDDIEVKVSDFNDDDTRFIGNYPVESLELTLEWMLEHNRPKDQQKIKIIQKYLQNNKQK